MAFKATLFLLTTFLVVTSIAAYVEVPAHAPAKVPAHSPANPPPVKAPTLAPPAKPPTYYLVPPPKAHAPVPQPSHAPSHHAPPAKAPAHAPPSHAPTHAPPAYAPKSPTYYHAPPPKAHAPVPSPSHAPSHHAPPAKAPAHASPSHAPAHAPKPPPYYHAPPPKAHAPVPSVHEPPTYAPSPSVKSKEDCTPLCFQRCRLAKSKRMCMRACTACCARCKCVPPGTYDPSLQSQILCFNLIFWLAKMMPPEQHPSPTPLKNSDPLPDRSKTLDPCTEATSFPIALMGLIPCAAFLLGLAGTVQTWNKRSQYSELWWDPNATCSFVWLDKKSTWKNSIRPGV
uniref:Uncharacterized protein n=1 Tax=Quercus lobata TaxID=97700 RepID=A0A7N2KZ10_QUELO